MKLLYLYLFKVYVQELYKLPIYKNKLKCESMGKKLSHLTSQQEWNNML